MADEYLIYLLFISIYQDHFRFGLKYAKWLLYFQVYLLLRAAVTHCHKVGVLKQHKFIVL